MIIVQRFAGYVPFPTERSSTLVVLRFYIVATYVGYDFNKSMKKVILEYRVLKALYQFGQTLRSLLSEKHYADYLDRVDHKPL